LWPQIGAAQDPAHESAKLSFGLAAPLPLPGFRLIVIVRRRFGGEAKQRFDDATRGWVPCPSCRPLIHVVVVAIKPRLRCTARTAGERYDAGRCRGPRVMLLRLQRPRRGFWRK
jgi:hypothetical protein